MVDRCVAVECCVDYDRRSGDPGLTDDLPICEPCLTAGERALGALPFQYVSLEQELPRSLGQWGDGQPAASDDHPVPLNVPVIDLQREIWHVLTTWEEVVREADKLSDSITKHVRNGWAVQEAAKILAPRVRLLAKIPPVLLADYPGLDEEERWHHAGVELADVPGWRGVLDFSRLHQRAQSLLGLTSPRPETVQLVPCRECDLVALYRVPGEDMIRCGSCSGIFTLAEFRRWTGLVAEFARSDGQDVA